MILAATTKDYRLVLVQSMDTEWIWNEQQGKLCKQFKAVIAHSLAHKICFRVTVALSIYAISLWLSLLKDQLFFKAPFSKAG